MSVTSSLLYRPILISQHQFPRLFRFSTFKLNLSQKNLSKTCSSQSTRYPIPCLMDSANNINLEGLEQEALVNESINSSSSGIQAILNSLSKWLISAVFGIIFLWRHDTETLWATSGGVLNVLLSASLKRILNHERPVSTLRADPGMPSSHAQSIFYTVTFCIISMVKYFGLNGLTAVISALFFAMGSYFSWLRVSQQLHTINQVAVGAVLGSCFSVFWFWLWDAIVLKAFIAHLWVRIVAVAGAAGFVLGFLLYVFRNWIVNGD